MDWSMFFNPSSWGSFAPGGGDPSGGIGKAAAPGGGMGGMNPQAAQQLFGMGSKMINPQQQAPQMAPIQMARPVGNTYPMPGAGRYGMLG